MTVRRILSIGHPALRVRAAEVPNDDIARAAIQDLIDDLIDTMRHANGSGIAANQIGASVRIMIMGGRQEPALPVQATHPPDGGHQSRVRAAQRPGRWSSTRGACQSRWRGELMRSVNLGIRYTDRYGNGHEQVLRGLTAGTWQHECDHLNGVLVVDRIDPRTLTTWEEFDRHHRDPFVERITRFVAEVGS